MPHNNIVIQKVSQNTITLIVNGELLEIPYNITQFRAALQEAKSQTFQIADKIYNIDSIDEANFNTILNLSNSKNVLVNSNLIAERDIHVGDNIINNPTPKIPHRLTTYLPKTDLKDLIGRDEDLKNLRRLLNHQKKVVLVNAMGGLGKTTLAQAYIHQYEQKYKHIAWITQTNNELSTDFVNADGLLQNLQIDASKFKPQELFGEILRQLHNITAKPNLLVIDNAEYIPLDLQSRLPAQPNWHLLITSRHQIEGYYTYHLDFLTPSEAQQLFKKHYTRTDLAEQDIHALLENIDYHTLTIEILAKTAQVQRLSAQQLHQALPTNAVAPIRVPHQQDTSEKIERILSYLSSIFALSQLSPTETYCLSQFACLPPEFLPYNTLQALLLDNQHLTQEDLPQTLNDLTESGWLLSNADQESYKMHPIIAQVIHQKQNIQVADVGLLINTISKNLSIDQSKDNPIDKFKWIVYGQALLKHFGEEQTPQISHLQNNLASVLRDLGKYDEAKILFEKVVSSNEKNFGEDHPTTAINYSNLASVLRDLGKYDEAKILFKKAMLSAEKNFGQDHPTTAIRYSNLALVLQNLGKYGEAKTLLEKAVQSDEKNFGQDHPTTAIRYSNLAGVLRDLGKYGEAKTLLEKAVQSNKKHFGEDHTTTANSYSNLASVLQNLGKYNKAKTLFEKAMLSNKKNFGQDHPNTAISYSNLASVLQDLGKYNKAKTLFEKAMLSNEKNFGEDHPTTAIRYSNLAGVLRDLGKYDEAKTLLEKAMRSDEKNFGQDHPTTAVSYSNLALVLKALNDYAQAKTLLEKAMRSNENNFGQDHPTTAAIYSNLALVLKALGDYSQAKTLLEKAMLSDEKNFGEDHPTTAISYANLAMVLQDLGKYDEAKTLLEKVMLLAEKNFGEDHPNTARSYSNLASVLQNLGKYDEAKTLFEKAMLSNEKNFGQDHPTTAVSYSNLAVVLQDLGDYTQAKTLFEKVMLSNEKNFGQDHPDTAISYSNLANVYYQMGNKDSCIALKQKALRIYQKAFPQGHPQIAVWEKELAWLIQND